MGYKRVLWRFDRYTKEMSKSSDFNDSIIGLTQNVTEG